MLNRDRKEYIFKKNLYCVICTKKRRDSLLNAVEEIDRSFKFDKNRINEFNLSQRNRYGFPKHETKDQL